MYYNNVKSSLSDVTGQIQNEKLKSDFGNVPQITQVHYHVEQTALWTKASVIIAGVGVLLTLISLLKGKK